MTLEAIDALKLRLAKGEISVSEFEELRNILLDTKPVSKQPPPSDSSLSLMVADKFQVINGYMHFQGGKYPLSSVKEIGFVKSSETTQISIFAWQKNETKLAITLDDGFVIEISDAKYFITGKIAPQIEQAYAILAQETYDLRVAKAVKEIKTTGKLDVGFYIEPRPFKLCRTWLTSSGTLLKDNGEQVDLVLVARDGLIKVGNEELPGWFNPIKVYRYSPNEVCIFADRSQNSSVFDFNLHNSNKDVALALIKWFSQGNKLRA